MRLPRWTWFPLGLAMALSGGAQAALVCTQGDALGLGHCDEVVSLGPLATEFSSQALTFDRWQSNAQAGFDESLIGVRASFGGTVDYDAFLKNFDLSVKSGGMVINELFTFTNSTGPADFLPAPILASSHSGLTFVLSPGQSIPIGIADTLADVVIARTTSLDQYIGPGTFQALVSGATGYDFTSNVAQFANVVLQTKGGSYGTAVPTVTLTYYFDTTVAPVPEPGEGALLAAGLAVLAAVLRRRRRRQASADRGA